MPILIALVALIALVIAPIPTIIIGAIIACVMFPPLGMIVLIALLWWWLF